MTPNPLSEAVDLLPEIKAQFEASIHDDDDNYNFSRMEMGAIIAALESLKPIAAGSVGHELVKVLKRKLADIGPSTYIKVYELDALAIITALEAAVPGAAPPTVEMVAEAIYDRRYNRQHAPRTEFEWRDENEAIKDEWRECAKAALAAIGGK